MCLLHKMLYYTTAIDSQGHAQSAQVNDSLCNAFGDFNDQILLWVVKTTTMVAHRLIMTFRTLQARAAATKPILSA